MIEKDIPKPSPRQLTIILPKMNSISHSTRTSGCSSLSFAQMQDQKINYLIGVK